MHKVLLSLVLAFTVCGVSYSADETFPNLPNPPAAKTTESCTAGGCTKGNCDRGNCDKGSCCRESTRTVTRTVTRHHAGRRFFGRVFGHRGCRSCN